MDSDEERIGKNTTEAFAILLFLNNFKAWIYEEKMNHGNGLLTEYDSLPSVGIMSIVDKRLVNQEIVLETGVEEVVVQDAASSECKKAAKTVSPSAATNSRSSTPVPSTNNKTHSNSLPRLKNGSNRKMNRVPKHCPLCPW
jgi:hypothetical protein